MLLPLIPSAVAAAIVAAAVVTAAALVFAGFGFFDYDVTAIEFLVVQAVDSGLPFPVVRHFDKTEAFGFTCEFIHDDFHGIHLAVLLKSILKVQLLSVEV